ncbi:MAG: Rrf2 family transcriptional regulator [Burkholderiales bacterium]
MRLQISTSLALYSVLEFAANPERAISAADIAAKYEVSTHHLAKVLRELVRAGILESTRGVGGGYRFGGNVKRLTLMDVIELFEDLGDRTGREHQPGASTNVGRALGVVLTEIDEIAEATFRSITVSTMLRLIARHGRTAGEQVPPKKTRRG